MLDPTGISRSGGDLLKKWELSIRSTVWIFGAGFRGRRANKTVVFRGMCNSHATAISRSSHI